MCDVTPCGSVMDVVMYVREMGFHERTCEIAKVLRLRAPSQWAPIVECCQSTFAVCCGVFPCVCADHAQRSRAPGHGR